MFPSFSCDVHPRWAIPFGVFVCAIAAHWGAFFADFYMDDFLQIVLRREVLEGVGWPDSWKGRWITNLLWRGVYLGFGDGPLGFHALNGCLHAVNAVLTWGVLLYFCRVGPEAVRFHARSIALIGALMFGCHPLGSEPVCYASQTSILLVTGFSLAGGLALLAWHENRPGLAAFGVGLAVMAASQSKEAGLWHALLTIAFLAMAALPVRRLLESCDRRTRLWFWLGAGGLGMIVSATWIQPVAATLSRPGLWSNHILTQARVFGEYMRRLLLPRDLCSDHRIMWTTSVADTDAVIKLGLVTMLTLVISVGLTRRKTRWWAATGALVVFPLLLRFAYIVDEPMVEYRVYPALPWFGLLLALVLARITVMRFERARFLQMGTAVAVLLLFGSMTWKRERVWRTEETLVCDVLEQYPLNLRALGIHFKLLLANGYPDVALMAKNLPDMIVQETLRRNAADASRKYSVPRLQQDYASCQYFLVRAEIHVGELDKALTRAQRLLIELLSGAREGSEDSRFVAFLSCATCYAFTGNQERLEQVLSQAKAVLEHGDKLPGALMPDLELAREGHGWYSADRNMGPGTAVVE